ncbi:hypothetical protein D3C71_1864460 [compost metagenome]
MRGFDLLSRIPKRESWPRTLPALSFFTIYLYEAEFQLAQSSVVGFKHISRLGRNRAGEGAGQNDFASVQEFAPRCQLVGQPGHSDRRVALHACGKTRLFHRTVLAQNGSAPR